MHYTTNIIRPVLLGDTFSNNSEQFICFSAHCGQPFGNSAFFLEAGKPYCEKGAYRLLYLGKLYF